ncbi:hypothetical protein SANT12839_087510 [Streptomyces antimycoticus]|uniref:Acyltransferase 3 domain-containing protein n=1 Tax=Streptomyces antimycoticus TaxID=68175 RepID=A0A4D4KPS9_9ACTN|nr:hypothetical protein SANT12839_087510 [Streptomyces antimycoticus]
MSTVSTTLTAAPATVRRPVNGTPAKGAPSRNRRNAEIQGFRGMAALLTVVFHVWQQYFTYDRDGAHSPVPNRYANALVSLEVIDFFFVLSAYLLTLSYARAAIDGGSTRPGRVFLFRRAIRIIPLYFLAVLCVWATRNPTLPGEWSDLVHHLTFTQVFDQEQIFYTIGPTWSLSLEIMFYLALVGLGPWPPVPAVRCASGPPGWRCAPPDVPCCTSGRSSGSRSPAMCWRFRTPNGRCTSDRRPASEGSRRAWAWP